MHQITKAHEILSKEIKGLPTFNRVVGRGASNILPCTSQNGCCLVCHTGGGQLHVCPAIIVNIAKGFSKIEVSIGQIHKNGGRTRARHFRTDRIFVDGFLPSKENQEYRSRKEKQKT